jgi:hypothetical protein
MNFQLVALIGNFFCYATASEASSLKRGKTARFKALPEAQRSSSRGTSGVLGIPSRPVLGGAYYWPMTKR